MTKVRFIKKRKILQTAIRLCSEFDGDCIIYKGNLYYVDLTNNEVFYVRKPTYEDFSMWRNDREVNG